MTMYQVGFILACSLLSAAYCQVNSSQGFTVNFGETLRTDLLTNYSSKIRPSPVTTVSLVFNLLSINDLETRTQTFSVSGFFIMVWNDSRLSWNQSDYGNIGFFFSDETEIWRPALVVKNSVDDISVIADEDVPFRITHEGRVFWNPPGIYKTNCDIDTTYYPFDTQTCSVMVQSWGYNLKELDLEKFGNGVDTSELQRNGEWDLTHPSSKRAERVDGVDSNTYATVVFEFILKRRTVYYGLNIILPVVVLSVLSGLVFVLPADSGEKMGYSLTVLLAFAVFLTLISDRMPTTSKNTSYMGVYLSVILCLCGLSVLMTITILDLHFREEPVSTWLSNFTRKILMPLTCKRGCRNNVGSAQISHGDPDKANKLSTRTTKKSKELDSAIWSGKNGSAPPVVRSHSEEEKLSGKEVARCLDALCFRLYMVAVAIVSIVFFTILGTNA